jgi:hypothetical protein
VAVDSQQAQKYFLYEIGYVGSVVPKPGRDEPSQPSAVLPLDIRYEGPLI